MNFWNTWCIPCQPELPALKQFYGRHADDPDFAFVGHRARRHQAPRRAWVRRRRRDRLDHRHRPEATAALAFGTRGQPETFAISPDGVVVGSQFGPSPVANLETLLAAARRVAAQ